MGAAKTGGSDDRDEKKIDPYSKQFKKNYKITDDNKVKKKNIVERYVDNSFITNNPFSKKSEEVNRKYFDETVKPAGKSKYDNYEDYIRARGRGEVDAMGRTITTRDNDNSSSQTIIEKNVGGKTIQTTEEKVEEDKKEATKYDPRKTKKKGRNQNILTSKQGVTQTEADYSLGKKSLLGQVI